MATRRDNSAARAALARRRQRAAQSLKPGGGGNDTTTTTDPSNYENVPNTSTAAVASRPPSMIRSSRPPTAAPPVARQPRPKPSLQVTTTGSSDNEHDQQHSIKEVIHSPDRSSRMSPLAKRAMNKHKKDSPTGTMTIDGTLTTAMTSTASTTNFSNNTSEMARKVLENSRQVAQDAHSVLNQQQQQQQRHASETTRTRVPGSSGLGNSSLLQRYASSSNRTKLNAHKTSERSERTKTTNDEGPLGARRKKLESVPEQRLTTTSSPKQTKSPSPQRRGSPQKTTQRASPQKKTPPSTSSDQVGVRDILASSRQRRANLEDKYRFNVASRAPQPSPPRRVATTNQSSPSSRTTRPAQRIQVTSRQRSPSPPSSKRNLSIPSLAKNKNHPSKEDPMSATRRKMEQSETRHDPLWASRRKMEGTDRSQPKAQPPQKHRRTVIEPPQPEPSQQTTTVIPRRNKSPRRQSPLKSISPKRFHLPPPSPPAQHQQNHGLPPSGRISSPRAAAVRQKSPSPRRAAMPSPRREDKKPAAVSSPKQIQQQQRPQPQATFSNRAYQSSQSPTRRQSKIPWNPSHAPQSTSRPRPTAIETMESEEETNNARSPYHHRDDDGPPNTVRVNSTPPRNETTSRHGSGRHSPGVERLSSFLMDSSSVNDISTIADMTLHQMESSPVFERTTQPRYPSSPQRPYPSSPQRPRPSSPQRPHPSSTTQLERSPRQPMHQNKPPPPPDDENHYDNIDDQATLDDGKLLTMDSACLKTGFTIMLRAYWNNSTIVGVGDNNNMETPAAPSGVCLGREEELLEVRKVFSNTSDSEDLRHGDTVVFFQMAKEGNSLGVRMGGPKGTHPFLGFFPSEGVSDTWMILSARPDREVLVGRAALSAKTAPANKTNCTSPPVRSGDHVLIRNCYNGGILSIDNRGNLALLTDSYGHMHAQDDPTLMGRLQNHDRLHPSPRETFQLLLSSTPPCPQWITGRSMDERFFLTGSYILQPRRNQRSAEFESNLFYQSSPLSYMNGSQRHTPSDANLSADVKEKILVDEVIGSFLGLEGRHIRLKGTKGHTSSLENYEFQLFRADGVSFDVSLTHLVEQILPLSTSYVRVRNFISSRHPGYEYGRVMHALCEGLDALLQDYVTFVAQLESMHRKYSKSDPLTMKNIYYQITPSLHSMSILEHATKEVCEKKGGDLINSLWSLDKRSYMGDSVAKKVLGILLDKASVPYMEMMSSWLETGLLKDPYGEFMIRRPSESKQKKQFELDGDAWTALFEINETHVLTDVITNDWTKKKILTTGKYWNAVNACAVDRKNFEENSSRDASKIPKLEFNSDSSAIAAYIDNMYQNASRVLVRLLMHNFRLMESLRTVRRYFLLDQGDFLMHFLDSSEMELVKPAEEVSIGRVQHNLSMAVQITEGYREDLDLAGGGMNETQPSLCLIDPKRLRCRFSTESLVAHLDSLYGGIADMDPVTPSRHVYGMSSKGNTGIEVFQIEFPRIPFPLSLALSRHAMDNYKLLFRHLFFTKHVERRLIGVWRDHQVLKKLDTVRGLLGPTFLLRQRMLHFVQNLIYYMTFEVIESNWMEMTSAIDFSSDPMAPQSQRHHTVDDILNVHDEFLQKTLEACLLSNKGVIRSLTKLMNTCLLFTDQMRRFMDTTKIYDDSQNIAAEKRGAIQKSLNERGTSQYARDKRALHRNLATLREERSNLHYRQTRKVGREVASDSYKKMVLRFDEVFNADLAEFMMQLNSHTATGLVANLGIRLDYNGYVTAAIASKNNR